MLIEIERRSVPWCEDVPEAHALEFIGGPDADRHGKGRWSCHVLDPEDDGCSIVRRRLDRVPFAHLLPLSRVHVWSTTALGPPELWPQGFIGSKMLLSI